jgi:predicted transposase YdaD
LEKLTAITKKPVVEMSGKERWGCFFRYFTDEANRRLIEEITTQEEAIAMAAEVIEGFSAEQVAYFHEISKEKYELDMRAHQDEAWETGRAAGHREIAKNLKEMGLPGDQIAAATGLDRETITAL